MWLDEKERAHLCVECGECLEKCPQHIEIPDWLAKADVLLSPHKGPQQQDAGERRDWGDLSSPSWVNRWTEKG